MKGLLLLLDDGIPTFLKDCTSPLLDAGTISLLDENSIPHQMMCVKAGGPLEICVAGISFHLKVWLVMLIVCSFYSKYSKHNKLTVDIKMITISSL